jgi:hypothetical protein
MQWERHKNSVWQSVCLMEHPSLHEDTLLLKTMVVSAPSLNIKYLVPWLSNIFPHRFLAIQSSGTKPQ